ncbi:AI-2E family transporter [Natrialba swarupiae]|uniref:AI-2E family transporter n=1 Tax=Natrialba swarupiae TaxID=2448032 RepID=A0A5D5ARA8_9EURY|nr:AI-2E family transporter [Natrialba swarupiae]TYT63614.1 AI-2E family transporter [Natrialba swarupiae]
MDVRTAFFALLLVVLGAIATLMIAPLLQYVLAAALLAFVLFPAYERLEPRLGSKIAALALTILAVVGAVVPLLFVSLIVLQTVASFLGDIDGASLVTRGREIARDEFGLEVEQIQALEMAVLTEIDSSLSNAAELALLELLSLVNTSIEMGLGLIVFVFLLYYLLADGETFVVWLREVVPLEEEVREELFAEINVVTWAVIKSHVLVAIVEGVLGGLGLYLLGVPNVAFWTIIMTVVAFLPAVGVWLVWAPAVGYLAITSGPVPALALFLYGVTVLSLVDNYLRAIFVDRDSGLHPAVVIVGVIGGIYLLGIMGLFLGPVLLAVFKAGLNVFSRYDFTAAGAESDRAVKTGEPLAEDSSPSATD